MDDAESYRDPATRYDGGFDKWDFDALQHRLITCHFSNALCVGLDGRGNVWWWWGEASAWARFSPWDAAAILAENALWVQTLRRAIPIIAMYSATTVAGEKEAAYQELNRLAESLAQQFQAATWFGLNGDMNCRPGVPCLYSGALREDLWQMPDVSPPPYKQAVFDHLIARSVADSLSIETPG